MWFQMPYVLCDCWLQDRLLNLCHIGRKVCWPSGILNYIKGDASLPASTQNCRMNPSFLGILPSTIHSIVKRFRLTRTFLIYISNRQQSLKSIVDTSCTHKLEIFWKSLFSPGYLLHLHNVTKSLHNSTTRSWNTTKMSELKAHLRWTDTESKCLVILAFQIYIVK